MGYIPTKDIFPIIFVSTMFHLKQSLTAIKLTEVTENAKIGATLNIREGTVNCWI
jgi:hypothetical protein